MRRLLVPKITGFKVKNVNVPIVIRDSNGNIFYDTNPLVPKVKYFNLPAGLFFVDSGDFTEAIFPRRYKLATLPTPERSKPAPFDFKIEFGHNPNKCSIIWDEKRILFDNSFLTGPQTELFFVLYHEYGHAFYHTEKYADLYASNLMKLKGYNPSQICYAHLNSLSSNQLDRKEFVTEKLINTL